SIARSRARLADSFAGENVMDLSDADHALASIADRVQDGRRWAHRKIMAICGPPKRAWLPHERSRDDTADAKRIAVVARNSANFVKTIERHDLFMRGDLQNGICRRVEDQPAALHVLGAEFLENRRAAAGVIADELDAGFRFDRVDEAVGEAFVDGKRLLQNRSRQLPVPGR